MSGFMVNYTHTERDLGLCCASRSISPPAMKSARKSLPYMDGQLDFSYVDGRPYFENRTLKFTFDLIADEPEELERQLCGLRELCAYVADADIYDDDAPGYHYRGSFDSMDEDEDDTGLSAEVAVSFTVEPYRIANEQSEAALAVGDNVVRNEGAWCRPSIAPNGTVTLQVGTVKQTYTGAAQCDIALERGENTVKVTGGTATLKWRERRL